MGSRIDSEQIRQLAPLLGSLARMAGAAVQPSEAGLQVLVQGIDLEPSRVLLDELNRWARLLYNLSQVRTLECRLATVEALALRGLPEATVLLAVDAVSNSSPAPAPAPVTSAPSPARAVAHLEADVRSLDLGILPAGQGGNVEFGVQGGPGQVVAQSDQVRVTPKELGAQPARLRVEVRPVVGGLLWTTLRLVTAAETVEIPLVAQWASDLATVAPTTAAEPKKVAPAPLPPILQHASASAQPVQARLDQVNPSPTGPAMPDRSDAPVPAPKAALRPRVMPPSPTVAPMNGLPLTLAPGMMLELVRVPAGSS